MDILSLLHMGCFEACYRFPLLTTLMKTVSITTGYITTGYMSSRQSEASQ